MGPIPPNVQPEKSPPNAPATNGQMAFATALAISSQSISIFMSFPFLVVVVVCRMQCLSGCGQYRPNVTPNTESAVGSRDRTARQSSDCLRVRPLRTPALSVMVRPASGSVLPTLARGALAALRRIPAPRGPLRPLRGSLRSGNLIASRQAHSSRFVWRKLVHQLASVRSMV